MTGASPPKFETEGSGDEKAEDKLIAVGSKRQHNSESEGSGDESHKAEDKLTGARFKKRGTSARGKCVSSKEKPESRIGTRSSTIAKDFSKQICFGQFLYET